MTADAHAEEHFAGSNKLFISIWIWLVVLTLVEIFLAYKPMSIFLMLTVLLGLSIIKSARARPAVAPGSGSAAQTSESCRGKTQPVAKYKPPAREQASGSNSGAQTSSA